MTIQIYFIFILHRFFWCSEKEMIGSWNQLLPQYLTNPINVDMKQGLLDELPSNNLEDQYKYLSVISNLHRYAWPDESENIRPEQRFCSVPK